MDDPKFICEICGLRYHTEIGRRIWCDRFHKHEADRAERVDRVIPKRWIDLSKVWQRLYDVAEERDKQKHNFASSRYWNQESHFHGLLAEYVYAVESKQEMNLELLIQGDGGKDFPETDVKGCTYWQDPWLKHPLRKPLVANRYVLVGLDIPRKRGYVVGIASKQQVKNAKVIDWGHGPQYSLRISL